jgi:2-polyprenyl-6-methoxyphenol hydroxylase-like FAD-dependent oxidoreductase
LAEFLRSRQATQALAAPIAEEFINANADEPTTLVLLSGDHRRAAAFTRNPSRRATILPVAFAEHALELFQDVGALPTEPRAHIALLPSAPFPMLVIQRQVRAYRCVAAGDAATIPTPWRER